jgi:uncharacterized protein (DUF885 family)
MNRRSFINITLGAAAASCGPSPTRAPDVFDGMLADITADLLEAQPEAGLLAAAPRAIRDRLYDRSPVAIDLQRAAALRRAAQWRGGIDRQSLSASYQQSFDVVDGHLSIMARASAFGFGRFDPVGGFSPYAVDHLQSACVTLPRLLKAALAGGDFNEAVLHLRRLKDVAAAIDGESASARADAQAGMIAPKFVLRRLQDAVAAMLSRPPAETVFVTALRARQVALKQLPSDSAPSAAPPDSAESRRTQKLMADAEAIVGGSIFPAYRRAFATLADLQVRATEYPGTALLPRGNEYYRACLSFHAGPAGQAEVIHRASLSRVKTLSGQLDMMQRSQGQADGEPARRLAALSADPRFLYPDAPESRDEIVNDVRREVSRMALLLPRVLRKPPVGSLDIAASDADDGQGYFGPALDSKRTAVLLIDVAFPRQTLRFALPALAHREGLPGRHVAALVAAQSDMPIIRKLLPGSAMRLGWASYAEQLADELGAYENAPYARIGYLRDLTLSAARAVVDTGIHGLNWSRDQSNQYLADAVGISASAADDIVADCAAAPGLACAGEAGRQEITRLRDDARTALGARFDIRDFHQAVLSAGEVPLQVLNSNVAAWIGATKSSKAF